MYDLTTASTITLGKQCDYCGKPYVKKPTEGRAHWESRRFCSTACSNAYQRESALHFPQPARWWLDVDPLMVLLGIGYAVVLVL
jgi:hypothetical protein